MTFADWLMALICFITFMWCASVARQAWLQRNWSKERKAYELSSGNHEFNIREVGLQFGADTITGFPKARFILVAGFRRFMGMHLVLCEGELDVMQLTALQRAAEQRSQLEDAFAHPEVERYDSLMREI